MGMFDDLIPQKPAAAAVPTAPAGGMFDDLIPKRAPAEPNADFNATRAVTQGATGFNEGLASTVLRPLDAIPYFVSKAMGGEGVHPLEGTFREHFVDPMGAPQNRVEQTLRAGGEMVGQNLPLMATGAGVAGSALRSGTTLAEQGVAPAIRGAADSVLEGMAAHPVASAVGENAGAMAAGAGGNIGRNVAKDAGGDESWQQAAELAGQTIAGPGAALYSKFSPGALAIKGAKVVGEKVLDSLPHGAIPEQMRPAGSYAERKADNLAYSNREGKYEDPSVPPPAEPNFATRRMDAGQATREDKAAAAASKEFNGIIAQPEAASNLAEAQRLEQAVPGFKPGVAKATQDPALLKLQENLEGKATGDELRGVQQAHDSNVAAIRTAKENIVPPVETSVPTVTGYHGSRDVIQKFDPEKTRLDRGVFFAEKPELANKFADGTAMDGDTARIYGEDSPAEIKRWVAEHAGVAESERIGAIIDQAEKLPWESPQKEILAKTVTDELGKITALDQEYGPSSPNVTRATLELGKNHKSDLGGRFDWDKERAAVDQARAKGADSVTFTNAGTGGDFHTVLNGDKIHPYGTDIRRQIENPQDLVAAANSKRVGGVQDRVEQQAAGVRQQIDQRTAATQQRLEAERGTLQADIEARQTAAQQRLQQEQDQAHGRVRDISNGLPETDPTVVGNELRTTRAALRQEADQRMSELRRNVDPTGRAVVELAPETPDGEPVRMSVNAALNRRAQINQDLADHYGASNRDQAAVRDIRRLQAQKTALDAGIETASGGDEGLRAYNDYYRDEYAPRFLQGASRDVGRFNRNGYEGQRVAAEDVPGEFFKPNNISEARQFNRLYGDNPDVRQRMTDFALDDLRRSAVDPNTGMIKEGAVNKWLMKNERVLNEMPWVRDEVTGRNPDQHYQRAAQAGEQQKLAANPKTLAQVDPEVGPLQTRAGQIADQQRLAANPKTIGQVEPEVEAMQRRFGQLEQRQRAVADTKVAGLLNKNPEQHIDAALNDWQVMKGLRNSVRGDPQAEAALRRAVLARAPDPMNVEKFQSFLDGHDRALRQVLEPDHLKALNDVLSAAKINNQLPRPKGSVDLPGSLADKGAKVFGITVPSLLQRVLSVKQGRMSPEYGVADVVTRAVRQFSNAEIESAWKEALYNPKVAKDLQLMVKGGAATPIQLARMRNYMLSVGLHDTEEQKGGKQLAPNAEN